jgi:16S rRNA (uracil1498-N3)-methyltransferase
VKRFYTTHIEGNIATPEEEESQHIYQVLRLKEGDIAEVTDGKGNLYRGTLHFLSKKKPFFELDLNAKFSIPSQVKCSLAVALTKNIDRIEWLIEKATEMGLHSFYPLLTQRTERDKMNHERMVKIAVSAMKQSGRLWLPEIHPITTFRELMPKADADIKMVAHCLEQTDKKYLSDVYTKGKSSLVLIGPEGDFTEAEINTAISNQYQPVSLGNSRLRVETAALMACATINQMNWK